ncbi:thiamine pyrophosphate-dependent dehydrogenase E1 component subunit alpha [Megasphaera paucivorans]|uniref:Pyruvate dehydrogenase E1 component alpha subunit n=1 Tax=Megasphaera paucivorans TaxID=349095 RepID=A0A1H0BPY8_9FIRM|nr:thiamine pyrophosphate-dependent dehydrogenase E1 component subunit alpha [Megasphaera paucivorans]SDN47671.1 pyruvate dehydrogenase E1 component alpha subunit [Megasphaera paucivorans]
MNISKETMQHMYITMKRIREFELKTQELFAEGKVPGFVHLYLGEEAVSAGTCEYLNDNDYITSTHRGHGHIIAKGGDMKYMMAELFGKATGYCKGKGGSMHIADRDKGILGANGIVGAGQDIALGAGFSINYKGTKQVCICFFGDGSTNQGTFHESLNLASIWHLPIVYVCENNNYAISMSQSRHQHIQNISDRGTAYGIPSLHIDGNNVIAVYKTIAAAVDRARKGEGPTLIECKTYRWRGHFEGDPAIYKPQEEQEAWLKKDPLLQFKTYLESNHFFNEDQLHIWDTAVCQEIDEAVRFADESPLPDINTVVNDVYSDITEEVRVR